MTQTAKTRTRSRGQHTRQPRERAATPASAAARARISSLSSPPSPLDRRRYFDFRAGKSAEEIAAQESVKLPTVLKSIEKMRAHAAEFSAESAELATREVYMRNLEEASQVLARALRATKNQPVTRVIGKHDPLSGDYYEEAVVVDEEVPDLAMQLKGQDALQRLLASVQPKSPMVTVDARSQTNIAGGATLQSGLPGGGAPLALSAEAIIRQVRADRGLALPSGAESTQQALPVAVIEQDSELDELEDDDEESDEASAEQAGADIAEGEITDADSDSDLDLDPDSLDDDSPEKDTT